MQFLRLKSVEIFTSHVNYDSLIMSAALSNKQQKLLKLGMEPKVNRAQIDDGAVCITGRTNDCVAK